MNLATKMKSIYASLFVLLALSFAVFLYSVITLDARGWDLYAKIYFVLTLGYTWYIFILLFLADLKKVIYPKYDNEKILVVVPCFNERGSLLRASLESVINANGNKEILVIDDGSKDEIRKEIKHVVEALQAGGAPLHVHYFDRNKGKRHALHYAVSNLLKDSHFVVTIDSDTILDKDALVRVVEPLKVYNIGASTGDVQLLNEKENLLTRMIATYYWIGLNIYKRAQSSRGMVVCCSGCLAAYRSSIIASIIEEFVNQEFLGEKCTHSEDRHLTNLVLKQGYDVVYTPLAVSYTETPATVKDFLKQQQRWKRGYIREAIYTLTYAWKTRKLLFFEILLWDLTAPFLTFGMHVSVILMLFIQPFFFFFYILPGWIIFMFLRYILVVVEARDKTWGLLTYTVFYMAFLYWMNIYALFTVKNKSWITRQ